MTLTFLPPQPTPVESLYEMPCAECGAPSIGWNVLTETDDEGNDVLTCWSTCAEHGGREQ